MHNHSRDHDSADIFSTTRRGIWAVKWSFLGLLITALLQLIVVIFSGSVALLADTIHNFGDALTAIPLWVAFMLGRRKPTRKFTYGYGRVEDLAGVAIIFALLLSAVIAAYFSIDHIFRPQKVGHLWAVALASIIGFVGNEIVAIFRIKVGKEISSTALIADGYHARADGLTSLAVLFGASGVSLGYPIADPLVGLLITLVILRIAWQSAKIVFTRLLDGVDPETIEDIKKVAKSVEGVLNVSDVRARWLGHRLYAEVNIAVNSRLPVRKGHEIALRVRERLLHNLRYLSNATIHVDPGDASGEKFHK